MADESRKREIWALYERLGNIDDVARASGMAAAEVKVLVDSMPLREMYRKKGSRIARYSDDDLRTLLREAAVACGEPLTLPTYHAKARENGWPSAATFTRRFGTWGRACAEAGVRANPERGPQRGALSIEDCLEGMRSCRDQFVGAGSLGPGQTPSYQRYVDWAREGPDRPSGPTVRSKIGLWSDAINMAFGESPNDVGNSDAILAEAVRAAALGDDEATAEAAARISPEPDESAIRRYLEEHETSTSPEEKETIVRRVVRNQKLVRGLKQLYGGQCQICGFTFVQANGGTYSEVAHIEPISKRQENLDVADNLLVLCANHHRMLDHEALEIEVDRDAGTLRAILDDEVLVMENRHIGVSP